MYICVTKLMYVILIQRICVICHVYNMYVYDDCSQQKMTISEIECIYWSLRHQANHHSSPLAATQSQWLRSLRIPPMLLGNPRTKFVEIFSIWENHETWGIVQPAMFDYQRVRSVSGVESCFCCNVF